MLEASWLIVALLTLVLLVLLFTARRSSISNESSTVRQLKEAQEEKNKGATDDLYSRQNRGIDHVSAPPKWKLYLITVPSAYVASSAIGIALLSLFPRWPFLVINIPITLLLVFVITYITQPVSMRLFRSWLTVSSRRTPVTGVSHPIDVVPPDRRIPITGVSHPIDVVPQNGRMPAITTGHLNGVVPQAKETSDVSRFNRQATWYW